MSEKTEYIDREALHEIFEDKMQDDNIMCPVVKVLDVLEIIENQPAADVQEVKHGKWKPYWDSEWQQPASSECSICKHRQIIETNYCSKCGAKMDGGK